MKLLNDFIENGTRPKTQRETSAILDAARSQILLLTNKLPQTMKLFPAHIQAQADENIRLKAELEALKSPPKTMTANPNFLSRKPNTPTLDRLLADGKAKEAAALVKPPVASAPIPPKPTGPTANTTAAEYEAQPPTMTKAEFDKMSPRAKSDFFLKSKGRVI